MIVMMIIKINLYNIKIYLWQIFRIDFTKIHKFDEINTKDCLNKRKSKNRKYIHTDHR